MRKTRLSRIVESLEDLKTKFYFMGTMWSIIIAALIILIILLSVGFFVHQHKICDLEDGQDELEQLIQDINSSTINISGLIVQVDMNTMDISDLIIQVNNNTINLLDLAVQVQDNTVDISQLRIDLDNLNMTVNDLRSEFDFLVDNFVSLVRDALGVVIYASSSTGSDSNPGTISEPVQTLKRAIELAKKDPYREIFLLGGAYTIDPVINFNENQVGLQSMKIVGQRQILGTFSCTNFTNSFLQSPEAPYIEGVIQSYDTICTITSGSLTPGAFNGKLASIVSEFTFVKENTADTFTLFGDGFGSGTQSVVVYDLISSISYGSAIQYQLSSGIFFENIDFSAPEMTTEGPVATSISLEKCKISTDRLNLIASPSIIMDAVYIESTAVFTIDTGGEASLTRVAAINTPVRFSRVTLSSSNFYVDAGTDSFIISERANVVLDGFYLSAFNGFDIRRSRLQVVTGKVDLNNCRPIRIGPFSVGNSFITLGRINNNPGFNVVSCLGGSGAYGIMLADDSELEFYGNLVTFTVKDDGKVFLSEGSKVSVRGTLIPTGSFSQLVSAQDTSFVAEVNEELFVNSSVIHPSSTSPIFSLVGCDLTSTTTAGAFRLTLQDVPRGIFLSSGRLYWRAGFITITTSDGYALKISDQTIATFDPIVAPIVFQSSSSVEPTVIIEDISSLNLKGNSYTLGSFGGQPCVHLANFAELNYRTTNLLGIIFDCDVYEIEARYMSNVNFVRPAIVTIEPTSVNSSRIGSLVNTTTSLLALPSAVITDGTGVGVENCNLMLQ